MTFGEPTESDFSLFGDDAMSAVEKIEQLPDSASFEQVMYDRLDRRFTIYESALSKRSPLKIICGSDVYKFAPLDIRKKFADEDLTISSLSAIQVILLDPQNECPPQDKTTPAMESSISLQCTINDVDLLFKQSVYSPLRISSVSEHNGTKALENQESADIRSFLFMCLKAMREDDPKARENDNLISYLQEDRLIERPHDKNGFESEVERSLFSMAVSSGQSSTVTRSTFPLGDTLGDASLTAETLYRENQHQNRLDSRLISQRLLPEELTELFQNITNLPVSEADRWAETRNQMDDIPQIIRSNDPDWVRVCTAFHAKIKPTLRKYEQDEESS